MRRTASFLSPVILEDLWESRVGNALRAVGLRSVRTTIVTLAVLATLIPALATSCISYRQNRLAIQAKLNEELTGTSAQAARETSLWLKERLYDLRVFATSYEVSENLERGGAVSRRLPDYLSSVKERFADYEELMVLAPDRRVVASSERTAGRLSLEGDWMQQARVGDAVLGVPHRPEPGRPAKIDVAVPIVNPSGRFLGVMGARLTLDGVEQLLKDMVAVRPDRRLVVLDRQGAVIASSGLPPTTFRADVMTGLQGTESTSVAYAAPDGVDVLGAMTPVARTEWGAVAELPAEIAYQDIRRLRNTTALLLVALLSLVLTMAWALGLLIVRPLERLSVAANRVAGGDLEVDVPASGGGEMSRLTVVFNDMVRRLREGRAELERLSVTDPLTGVANRRRLELELERELRRSDRHGHPFAILMLDVDRFKDFNDTYGHPAGDAVLKRLAAHLKDSVRDVDTVARYGGEEFLVILPEAPESEAVRAAERIRAAIEKDRFVPDGTDAEVNITVSIGYAVFPDHAHTPEAMVEAADSALYKSKEAGRNRATAAARSTSEKPAPKKRKTAT